MTAPITSGGNGVDVPINAATLYAENPHIKFVNTQRGYVVCDLTHERYQTSYRVVPFVTTQGAPATTRASFVVENCVPGVNPVCESPSPHCLPFPTRGPFLECGA